MVCTACRYVILISMLLILGGCPGTLQVPKEVSLAASAKGEPVSTKVVVTGSYCESAKTEVREKHAKWLSVAPANVKLGDEVTITADPAALDPGTHEGSVYLYPDKGSGMWTIQVKFVVR
ncbi:MAG: hypothetical protein H6840_09850 [Planctomycetes bacterium]|nr:hypothetical protein [Planctomycetota bacterium]